MRKFGMLAQRWMLAISRPGPSQLCGATLT